MSTQYKKVTGHKDPTVFTTEVILEREDGENGDPTVVAQVGVPSNNLTAEHVKTLEGMGFVVEDSSKDEYEQVQEHGVSAAADDVAGAAPLLGNLSSNPAPGEGPSETGDSNDNDSASRKGTSGDKK